MKKQKLYGLNGQAQCGKDTFASYATKLLKNNYKVEKLALAYYLKHFCMDYLKVPSKSLYGTADDKNYPIGKFLDVFSPEFCQSIGHDPYDLVCGRQIAQIVGTEIFRECFGQDIWINLLRSDIVKSDADVIFVTDVRFPNEVHGIKESGGKIIRLYRDVAEMSHKSESLVYSVPDEEIDYIIGEDQNKNIKQLQQNVANILSQEGLLGEVGAI